LFRFRFSDGFSADLLLRPQSMMPKSVNRFSDDIMLCFFDVEADPDFRSIRPEIIRL